MNQLRYVKLANEILQYSIDTVNDDFENDVPEMPVEAIIWAKVALEAAKRGVL